MSSRDRKSRRRRPSYGTGLIGTLIDLGRECETRRRDLLEAAGLSVREHDVLQLIADSEPKSQLEIGAKLGMDPSSVSQIVSILQLRGLIEVLMKLSHARQYRETVRGRQLRQSLEESLQEFEDVLSAAVPAGFGAAVDAVVRSMPR